MWPQYNDQNGEINIATVLLSMTLFKVSELSNEYPFHGPGYNPGSYIAFIAMPF